MSNEYRKLRDRQQEEINAFPLGFAFSNKQFNEMMAEWGLDPEKDLDKIAKLPHNVGGFIRKTDVLKFLELCTRHQKERDEAIAADTDGTGYIYDMFRTELDNHEYGYTGSDEDTITSLGYTYEDIAADNRLANGLKKAKKDIYSRR